ncbi:MAG: PAS domain S-box protein [Rhizobiaceae bacterium]|nr:PAS domain S-box protein [Rhizobiaceae bacterium]
MDALPVAVYTTDAEGRITYFNEAAATLWGHRPIVGETRWCGTWRLYTPHGDPQQHSDSALAVAIRERRQPDWVPAILERPDGTRIPFSSFPVLLFDQAGNLTGAINTLMDISRQHDAAAADLRMAAIVDSSLDAIVSKDLTSTITSWNSAAEQLFGYTAEEAVGRNVAMLFPDDRQHEEAVIIGRIQRGERVETYETIRRRKDGTLIPVSLTVSPIRDAAGRIVGASKIARDISASKDSEKRIRLLMREVNHRVKNQYAVILSMIRETNKRAQGSADFERQVRERIMALSRSHDLLVMGDWKGTTINDLLRSQVTPFGGEDMVEMLGPPLMLNPSAVQYLGIAFHELATNSSKYGALSGHDGRIRVSWSVEGEGPDRRFHLTWEETGGQTGGAGDGGGGFGTVVLERVTPQAVGGQGRVVYDAAGMRWILEAPMHFVEPSSPTGPDWQLSHQ